MITKNSAQEFTLQLSNTYPVKKEKVFHAWTKPEQLEQWWGPEGFKTTIDEMNVEVNGSYKFNMHAPDGSVHVVGGQYLEITPNDQLVFTWKWDNHEADFPITKVTVDFLETEEGTKVTIHHTGLPSEESAQHHTHGWTSFLEVTLETYLQK
ncbi:SRPBCC family protein [Sutcliffiella horikoshii]|uniref:SRPBCC domain-containing protein n=1 Tax=Sutcliffiella horikoshii TaxID=79883 RepID=A0A1Y0CIM0_9BACI|nr:MULTISPECIES: SRPBCC domain-containing protein [Bacillaceae]ART74904.1 hypothetical protein B4U37_02060 [Sutcliffiella horikoshii]TYS67327.1 SRPBCC domain-containing protein [Sutcliffiella horikoshii]